MGKLIEGESYINKWDFDRIVRRNRKDIVDVRAVIWTDHEASWLDIYFNFNKESSNPYISEYTSIYSSERMEEQSEDLNKLQKYWVRKLKGWCLDFNISVNNFKSNI